MMLYFSNNDRELNDIHSDIATFFSDDMGLNTIYLNNINLDDANFDNYDPETIIDVRFMVWFNR